MPWLVKKKRKGGARFLIQYRDGAGRTRTIALDTGDRRKAQAELNAFKRGQQGPKAVPAPDALLRFYRSLEYLGRSEATVAYYREKLDAILAHLGPDMRRWSADRLEGWYASKDWQPRTIQMHHNAAKRFYSWCRKKRVECPDFVSGVDVPHVSAPPRKALGRKDVADLLDAAEGWLELAIGLAYYGALSLGDLRALTWEQVDLDAGLIAKPREKTGQDIRLPILPALDALLRKHRALSGPVVRGPKGNWSKHLTTLQRKVGTPKAPKGNNGWHRFRHSIGTHLMEAKVHPNVISAILGHAPGSRMRDLYIHPDDDTMRAEMNRALGG